MAGGSQEENPSELEQILEIVYIHLAGDRNRVDRWLRTPHGALGGQQPIDLIRQGRAERVLEAVQSEIDARENAR